MGLERGLLASSPSLLPAGVHFRLGEYLSHYVQVVEVAGFQLGRSPPALSNETPGKALTAAFAPSRNKRNRS